MLNQRFLQALRLDFDAHGREAIEECRKQSPLGYVKVLGHLVPREMKVEPARCVGFGLSLFRHGAGVRYLGLTPTWPASGRLP